MLNFYMRLLNFELLQRLLNLEMTPIGIVVMMMMMKLYPKLTKKTHSGLTEQRQKMMRQMKKLNQMSLTLQITP